MATVVANDANPEDQITGYVISGGEDRTKFVIDLSGALSFAIAPNFESPGSSDGSNVYIVDVTATSGEGARRLTGFQTITVTVVDVNDPPRFTRTAFSHPENSTEVVEMLASDEDDDEVTGYVIAGGPDSDLFSIDPDSGILSFVSAPSYQRRGSAAQSNLYTIWMTATSGTGDRELSTTQTITVQVIYVREIHIPTFNEGSSATRTVPEDAILGTAVGNPVSATDPDQQRLEYWLSGVDQQFFDVNPGTGQLSIAAPLDYETQREYSVWIKVRDSGGSSASITVTIEVENVDEPAAIALSPTKVETGALVSAVLSDPDGGVAYTAWQWQASMGGTAWSNVSEATSQSYMPVGVDEGKFLRVVATYADGHGPGKEKVSASTAPVLPSPSLDPSVLSALATKAESGDMVRTHPMSATNPVQAQLRMPKPGWSR